MVYYLGVISFDVGGDPTRHLLGGWVINAIDVSLSSGIFVPLAAEVVDAIA